MKFPSLDRFAKGSLVALVLASTLTIAANAAPAPLIAWQFGPPSPFAFTRFDGETVPGMGTFFLGGRAADNSTDGTIWRFDGSTYTPTGASMLVPVSNYKIAMLTDGFGEVGLYIFGGRDNNGNIINAVQIYDPLTDTALIDTADPYPGTTPSGCIALPATGVAVLSNTAIVVGGSSFSSSGCVDDNTTQTWIYNPVASAGHRWRRTGDLSHARGYITTAVVGNKVLAIGGDVNHAGTLSARSTVEVLNTQGNWNDSLAADLPEPCDESQAFGFNSGSLAKHVILAGCGQWPNALPDSWNLDYHSAPGSWTATTPLNQARRNHAGSSFPTALNEIFLLGGYAPDGVTVLQTSEISPAQPPIRGIIPRLPAPFVITSGAPTNN